MKENPVDSKKSDSGGEGVSAGLTMMDECNEEEAWMLLAEGKTVCIY